MAQASEKSPGGMRRWLRLLLVASLAFNLLIIGLIGGAMVMRSKWHGQNMSRLETMGGPLTRALSREDRSVIRSEMQQNFGDRDALHADMRAGMDDLIVDLKADPFDADAVAARLAQHRTHFSERLEMGQAMLLKRLSAMSATDRAAFADRLQNGMARHWQGKPYRYTHE